ncbi:MAG: extracellular solute-binding protein [Xanthobacteraceae bacterium]
MILGKTRGRIIMANRLTKLAAALGLIALGARPAGAQSLDDLYAKAKGEGAFVLYVGGPTAPWEAMAKVFNAKYPGITVSISGGFSNVLDKKIDTQIAAGKLEVDAAILQTIADYVRWKADSHLIDFKPAGFDKIDSRFKDPDGAYWATMVNAVPYMYNTEKVAAADIPNSALDFLKPQFQGKAVTPYPADDDVTLWVFYHIVQKYGWGYMDKYMATKPNFIQGHLGEQRSIGSGQNLVTFDSIYNITTVLKKQGMKVDSHFATEDATPFWPLSGAIFKGAPHPNAAKLFLTWLLEPAQQVATETWSGRGDVPPPSGYKPIFSYKVVTDYRAFLVDQNKVADLRKRFEKYSGPVVNAGGVR